MDNVVEYLIKNWPELVIPLVFISAFIFFFGKHIATIQSVNEELRKDFERVRNENKDALSEVKGLRESNKLLELKQIILEKQQIEDRKSFQQLGESIALIQKTVLEFASQVDNLAAAMATISNQVAALESSSVGKSLFADLHSQLREHGFKLVNLERLLAESAKAASSRSNLVELP